MYPESVVSLFILPSSVCPCVPVQSPFENISFVHYNPHHHHHGPFVTLFPIPVPCPHSLIHKYFNHFNTLLWGSYKCNTRSLPRFLGREHTLKNKLLQQVSIKHSFFHFSQMGGGWGGDFSHFIFIKVHKMF